MIESEALEIFENAGAILKGHFQYSSGRHGDRYIDKDAVYAYPESISRLAYAMAVEFWNCGIETVIGPASGGIILAQWTAFHLGRLSWKPVLSLYAEKEDGAFVLRRGDAAGKLPGKKTLIVDDVMTTGRSVWKTYEAASVIGADVRGVGVLWNRGDFTAEHLGITAKFHAVIAERLNDWSADSCTLTGAPLIVT